MPRMRWSLERQIIHEEYQTNLIGEFVVEKGDAAAALADAPKRLRRSFYTHRYAGVPIECRGVIGAYDQRTDSVTIWSSTQVVHWVRREAAAILRMPESRVRCVALDVGGGFGTKGHVYPEDLLVPLPGPPGRAPGTLDRGRGRNISYLACHSRDQLHEVEVGFDWRGPRDRVPR